MCHVKKTKKYNINDSFCFFKSYWPYLLSDDCFNNMRLLMAILYLEVSNKLM